MRFESAEGHFVSPTFIEDLPVFATLAKAPIAPGGHRLGTALIERDKIFALLGKPTHDWRGQEHDDGKVTIVWVFQTPRGQAELRDYWWNGQNEWSIAAQNIHAARFLAKHLRAIGAPASTRFNYAKDCKHFYQGKA